MTRLSPSPPRLSVPCVRWVTGGLPATGSALRVQGDATIFTMGDEAVLGRSGGRRDAVWQRARLLGLGGGRPVAAPTWQASPAEATLEALARDDLARRLTDAGDPERLATALNWLGKFRLACPSRPFLLPRGGGSDLVSDVHNRESFALLRSFIRSFGSSKPGEEGRLVSADAIGGYVSTLHSASAILSGVEVVSGNTGATERVLGKQMRPEQPLAEVGERKLRLGLRVALLRRALALGWDVSSPRGEDDWSVLLTGVQALLRGGEFGVTRRTHRFVMTRGLHWGDECVRWKTAASIGADRPSVSLWVCPIKDVAGRHVRQEIPIAAMHVDGESDDPLCTYSCLLRRWRRHAVHLSVQERRRTPLFQLPGGAPYCTDDVDRLVERVVVFLGLDPKLYGAVSLRIAGATDLRDALGMAGADLIKARGRWSSDIGFIYQLVTEAEMLEASVSMMAAERPERARNTGVAQPAVRRRYW